MEPFFSFAAAQPMEFYQQNFDALVAVFGRPCVERIMALIRLRESS